MEVSAALTASEMRLYAHGDCHNLCGCISVTAVSTCSPVYFAECEVDLQKGVAARWVTHGKLLTAVEDQHGGKKCSDDGCMYRHVRLILVKKRPLTSVVVPVTIT